MSDLDDLLLLPDPLKEQLAYDLLTELGAQHIRRSGDELVHGCMVCIHHRDQDHNPTAALNWRKLLWHCFSGSGGTVLHLVAHVHGGTVEEARAWVHDRAGVGRAVELPQLLALFDQLYTPVRPEPLPVYSPRILEHWRGPVPPYAAERCIPEQTARRMGLVTDPVGMVNQEPTGPRMVIPHYWKGQLVGWQSRRLPGSAGPKYCSTPGFPADTTVYNHDPAAPVVVGVESPASVLRHMHHLHMESTFGASVTLRQLQLLAASTGRTREVVWWMDNDPAGWMATESRTTNGRHQPGAPEQLAAMAPVRVVDNPFAADPADLDDTTTTLLVAQALPWPVWERPHTLLCHRCYHPEHPEQPCLPRRAIDPLSPGFRAT